MHHHNQLKHYTPKIGQRGRDGILLICRRFQPSKRGRSGSAAQLQSPAAIHQEQDRNRDPEESGEEGAQAQTETGAAEQVQEKDGERSRADANARDQRRIRDPEESGAAVPYQDWPRQRQVDQDHHTEAGRQLHRGPVSDSQAGGLGGRW